MAMNRGQVMQAKLALLLIVSGSLATCSPPTFDIIAQGTAEAVVFTARDRDDRDTMQYVEADTLTVRNSTGVAWAINFQGTQACREARRSRHPFPLSYGEVPTCWMQTEAPQPLRPGITYTVDGGSGSKQGSGDFRIEGQRVIFIDTRGNW
jgi:hypothetical protein